MKTEVKKQLHSITGRQQRKIWLRRITARFYPAMWIATLTLLTCALLHHFLFSVNILLASSIALAPPLLYLGWLVISQKPVMYDAAVSADKLFNAHSLFTSAWELSSRPVQTDINKLILSRSEIELAGWTQLSNNQKKTYIRPATLVAITLSLVSLFSLLLPSTEKHQVIVSANSIIQNNTYNPGDEKAQTLSHLFNSPGKARYENSATITNLSDLKGRQNSPAITTSEALPSDNTIAAEKKRLRFLQTEPSGVQPQTTSTTDNENKISLNQPGNDEATKTTQRTVKARVFDQIKFIDIPSDKISTSVSFDPSRAGSKLNLSGPEQTLLRLPAKRQNSKLLPGTSNSLLDTTQLMLVRRYFNQLEKINEPRE